ncbi:hypothetical protein AAG570_007086 [Ranatra chinensis]|uniref:Uncharacterized protein n=1 Tax=Ranatra chinensis TaxID=642074 RepID=A0ABD0YIP6_9HEMI
MRAGGGRPGGDLFIESIASGSGGRLLTCVLGPGYDPYGRLTQLSVMLSPGRLDSSRRTLCQCWRPVDLSPRAIVLASFDPFRRPLTTLVISYAGLRPQTRRGRKQGVPTERGSERCEMDRKEAFSDRQTELQNLCRE